MKYVRFGISSLALAAMSAGMMTQPVQMQQAKAPPKPAPRAPAPPVARAPAPPPAAVPPTPTLQAPAPVQTAIGAGLPYAIEVGGAPPERTRTFGDGTRTPSPFHALFSEMPMPEGDNYAQVFIPIPAGSVPATVTDPAEVEKAGKEASRKLVNNLGSIARRIRKGDETFAVTMRETIEDYDGATTRGVRVWRIAPAAQTAEDSTEQAATAA